MFGDVSGPPHPHRYRCDITVGGRVDARTGTIVDLRVLDGILAEEIVRRFDGKTLNERDELRRGAVVPTSENLARLIAQLVRRALRDRRASARVTEVRVAEDDTLSATWRATR
jgi:6-pyruvoyltetrahydropterin/6-carboxytetrahydropterin synthase